MTLMENTIEVDNEHFYSDHLIKRNDLISSATYNNIIDPFGLRRKHLKRKSFDVKEF